MNSVQIGCLSVWNQRVYVPMDKLKEPDLPEGYIESGSGDGEHECIHAAYLSVERKFYKEDGIHYVYTFGDTPQTDVEWSDGRVRYHHKIEGRIWNMTIRFASNDWLAERWVLKDYGYADCYVGEGRRESAAWDDLHFYRTTRAYPTDTWYYGPYTLVDPQYMVEQWRSMIDERVYNNLVISSVNQLRNNTNNWQNVSAIFELVKALKDPVGEISTSIKKLSGLLDKESSAKTLKELLGDSWLKKRYAYDTSLSDFKELLRYLDLGGVTVLRAASTDENGIVYHSKTEITPFDSGLRNITLLTGADLYDSGFAPSLYNLWDSVPFSFVVDWFLPIGDALEQLESFTWYGLMPYNCSSLVSAKVQIENNQYTAKYYERKAWVINDFTYQPEGLSTNPVVWGHRMGDAAALFL